MEKFPEPVTRWKCPICGKEHATEAQADKCGYEDLKERCINHDFKAGWPLDQINKWYNLYMNLSDAQKKITKDNCFTISYLQCCEYPAYRITHISAGGRITVSGIGSWSGGYSSEVRLGCLENPRPKEELYVDKRFRKEEA